MGMRIGIMEMIGTTETITTGKATDTSMKNIEAASAW